MITRTTAVAFVLNTQKYVAIQNIRERMTESERKTKR